MLKYISHSVNSQKDIMNISRGFLYKSLNLYLVLNLDSKYSSI